MKTIKSLLLVATCVGFAGFSSIGFAENLHLSDRDNKSFWSWIEGDDNEKNEEKAKDKPLVNPNSFAGNYLASRYAQQQRDWEAAHDFLENAIKLEKTDSDFDSRRLVIALGAGEIDEAVRIGRDIAANNPDALSDFGELLLIADDFKSENYDLAIEKLNNIRSGPFKILVQPVMLRWALLANNQEDTREANEKSALDLLHSALVAELRGNSKAAQEHYERLSLVDKTAQTRLLTADYFARQGKIDKATDIYASLNEENPDFTGFDERLDALAEEDQETFDNIIKTSHLNNPKDGAAMAVTNIARYFFQERSYDSALLFAQIAKHMSGDARGLNITLGDIYAKQNQLDKALATYRTEPNTTPYYLQAQLKAVQTLRLQENLEQANKQAQSLLKTFPNNAEALYQYAEVLRAQENFDKAIDVYNKIEALFAGTDAAFPKRYANIYYVRGIAYEQAGKWPKAAENFEKALSYFPQNPYILNYYGYGLADRGERLEEALEMIKSAVALRPYDGYIRDSLGWVHYKFGDFEKAANVLERAVELEAYDSIINDHLGDAYWQVGRKSEAKFQWRRALNYAEDPELIDSITEKLKSGLSAQTDL